VLCGEILLDKGIRFYEVSYKDQVSGKVDAIAYPESALGGTPGNLTLKREIKVKGPSMSIFTTPVLA
jgi:hypothetical protein